MEITKQQLQTILKNKPMGANNRTIVEGLIKKGYNIEGLDPLTTSAYRTETRVQEEIQGNVFDEKPKTFWGKARDFAANIVGGRYLAEGLGKALAAPEVQSTLSDTMTSLQSTQLDLINKIREKTANGEDTTKFEALLRINQADIKRISDVSSDFIESLPSNKQVIGSATRLAGTAVGGALASGVTKAGTGTAGILGTTRGAERVGGLAQAFAPKSAGFLGGAVSGAKIGATTGAIEGGIQGAGLAAEQEQDAGGIVMGGLGGAALGGVTGGVLGGVIGGVSGRLQASRDLKAQTEAIIKNKPDSRVAKYMIDGQGKVVNDPVAKEVIKQGLDEGTVATIKGASAKDKQAMNKALDILEQRKLDKKYAALNRSSDVVGETAMDRVKFVQSANQKAAQQLEGVAKSLKGQSVDPTPAAQSFIDDLSDLGVTFSNGKPVFKGSNIEGVTPAEGLITKIINRMKEVGDDAYDLHNLKKFIDEQVSYGKAGEGLTGNTERIVKALRSNIDSLLDNNFAQYNQVNTQYSTTRQALDSFLDAAGSKFDITKAGAEKQLGTLMRRLLSNAQSRVQVQNALDDIQNVAETFGGKFDDDIISQMVFVDELERVFGSQAPTSFQGGIEKGIQKGVNVARKLKDTTGMFDLALEGIGTGIEKARGINEENLIKSLRQILSN
jgi:hypothetical protein